MLKKFLWWIPALVMMVIIFRLSMDTGEESSSLSGSFAGFLHMPEWLVRKLAHITEYFVLTFCISLGLMKGMGLDKKRVIIFTLIIAFLYAGSDEIHQRFVGDRSGKFPDVLVDGIGIVAYTGIYALIRRKK